MKAAEILSFPVLYRLKNVVKKRSLGLIALPAEVAVAQVYHWFENGGRGDIVDVS